jgi:Flp pilus assembly protein TadD
LLGEAQDLRGHFMEQSEPPTRELTLEEAVSIAILLQKNEQLVEAQELYRRVLKTAPSHPQALHYSGVLAHQQGRIDEAVILIEKSLELQPDQADCYNNLGIILQSSGKLEKAVEAYQRAIKNRSEPRECLQQSWRAVTSDQKTIGSGSSESPMCTSCPSVYSTFEI